MDLLPRLVHQVRSREQPSTNSLDGGVIRSIGWRHNDEGPSDGLTRDDNPTVDHRLRVEPTPRRIPSSVQRKPRGRGHNEYCPIHSKVAKADCNGQRWYRAIRAEG